MLKVRKSVVVRAVMTASLRVGCSVAMSVVCLAEPSAGSWAVSLVALSVARMVAEMVAMSVGGWVVSLVVLSAARMAGKMV